MQCTSYHNFLHKKISYLHALQGNREIGARYLDSKYSTWISTDPALGEYIPQAPVSDEARKHNQNLPGMGGIFNHINTNLYAYGANNPLHYIDPDGNYVVLNESQHKRTENFVKLTKSNSIYFGFGDERRVVFGYYFSDMLGENPQRISSLSTLKSPSITMSSPFSNTKINSNSELSMNGNLETGFKLVDKYKKTSSTVTPKVYACVSAKQDGIATIDVIIEIDNYSYSGTVAYAGLSEVQTNGKDDKAKIDKIANESINFLRGTSNEIKNLTE